MSDSFVTLWTVAHQAPQSMGFPRQEYWSGLSFPSPGDFPDPGIEPVSPGSPALAGGFFTTEPHRKSIQTLLDILIILSHLILEMYVLPTFHKWEKGDSKRLVRQNLNFNNQDLRNTKTLSMRLNCLSALGYSRISSWV